MTLQRPKVQQIATGRGDNDPAAAVAPSAAALAGQALLEARRRELGINYRRPAAVDSRAWLADLAGAALDLDQAAASTVDQSPAKLRHKKGDDLDAAALKITTARASTRAGIVGAQTIDQGGRSVLVTHTEPAAALAGVMATVYPSLAAAFGTSKLSRVGRLWVLLRAWDDRGRGLYDLDQVYQVFSVEGSPWHFGGRRCLQQLIKKGAGIFWTLRNRRGGRFTALQMTGPAGVAAALKVSHLAGSPVAVPVADLLGGMHKVKAALFSAALTLRTDDHGGRPTSRATLKGMTGAAASTQRTYITTAGVEARPNYVTLPSGDIDRPGVFVYRGRVDGRPGRAILARRLPNSHDPQLTARPRGRVKKINRKLNLVTKGARGERLKIDRIYHDTAAAAWSAWERAYNHDHYWPCGHTAAGAAFWGMVEAVNQ